MKMAQYDYAIIYAKFVLIKGNSSFYFIQGAYLMRIK